MTALGNERYGLRVRPPAQACLRNRQPRWSEAEPLWKAAEDLETGQWVFYPVLGMFRVCRVRGPGNWPAGCVAGVPGADPAGSVSAFLRAPRRAVPGGMFADMYPSPNGRPSTPPQVLAVTVVLQALYGLPDHDAALALRYDLRWKAACGLGVLARASTRR